MKSRGFIYGTGTGARRSLTLLWTAAFVCSLLLQSVALSAPAPARAALPGNFELDGNTTVGGGTDWNGVYNDPETFFKNDPASSASDDILKGGGSKDNSDIPNWLWTNQNVQPKDDIVNAYAYPFKAGNGDTIAFFGQDRLQSNGDAVVGFWFFKDTVAKTNTASQGGFLFSGEHQVGDIFVVADYSNGGAQGDIAVYEWVGSGGDTEGVLDCVSDSYAGTTCPSATNEAEAYTNDGAAIDAAWRNGIPENAFFEGGVNLTDLGLDTGCFSSFMAESRSSTSFDSTASDIVLGQFSFCTKPDIETHVRQSGDNISVINKGESVYDHAVLTGDNGTVEGSVKFFVCRDADANPDCSTGGDQVGGKVDLVDGKANSADFTPTQLGFYCFRVEYTAAAGSKYLDSSHTNKTTECFQVIPAEIKLTKTADAGTVSAGDPIGFTLTILSKGPGAAYGVKVADTLPTNGGLAWTIDAANTTGTWVIDGGVLRFGGADGITMAKDASYHVHITSPTTKATCGVVNNTGDATTTNDGTSTDSASVTVQCPDVAVTKLPDDGSISAGDTATFTIKVQNLGPGTAYGVTVSDTLPAGPAWTEDEADCSIAGGVLSCTVGTLADGASKTYTVSAPTTKDHCGVLDNTATASATNEPGDKLGNNSDTGAITVRCAAIDVEKTADAASVTAGDPIGFTITVTNTGTGTAYGVTASDTLNPAFTWSIATPVTGWTLVGNQLAFSAASLAPGASTSVHVTAPTTAANCGVVPNTATAAAANDGSDSDDAQTTILCPDVTVTKRAVTGTVSAGELVAFDITVKNLGPGVAKNVTLTDTLPAGITWNEDSTACSIVAGVLSCTFGDLAVAGTATVRVSGVTSNANCGVVRNTAVVAAANEPSGATGNNSSTDTVQVDCPDISVVKTADATPISAGDVASFTILVTNEGPGTAYGVTLTDTLPAGMTWSETSAACAIAGGVLSCDFGTMADGATRSVTVTATTTPAQCGNLPNTVTVAAVNELPGQTENNTSTATVVVQCPDLKVTKTEAKSPINAGDTAGFTILVENTGAGKAYGVTLTDTLPGAGIAWSEDSDACSITGNVLSCTFGTLLPGASRTVTLTGDTTVDNCGTLPNLATAVATNEPANAPDPNSDDATILVDCPDVVITKTAIDDRVNAGDDIAFDIEITNLGDGAAYDVEVKDVLPVVPGVTFAIDAANSDAGWSLSGGTLSFGPATLAAGASTSVRIVSGTTAESCTTIPNRATLDYRGAPDGLGNGATIVVDCPDVTISKTAAKSPVLAGEDASFEISVWNEGPGTAADVVISDELPAGVAWTEDSEACDIVDGILTCQVGDLAEDASPFTVTVSGSTTVEVCGDLDNLAEVSAANEPAGNQGNNEDDATVEVQCASISLVKLAGDAADGTDLVLEEPGDVIFTYLVENTGTADLVNLMLVDDNATPGDASDDIDVTCPSTSLAAGAKMTCKATLPVDYGTRTNIAVVTANPEIAPEEEVTDADDAVVFVPEPVETPTPKPTRTPRITPPPTSTIDSPETPISAGSGLLLVLLSLAGIMLALWYLIPSPARSRRRNGRG